MTIAETAREERDYVRVEIRLGRDLAEEFARVHGDVPRAIYIRRLIERHIRRAGKGRR